MAIFNAYITLLNSVLKGVCKVTYDDIYAKGDLHTKPDQIVFESNDIKERKVLLTSKYAWVIKEAPQGITLYPTSSSEGLTGEFIIYISPIEVNTSIDKNINVSIENTKLSINLPIVHKGLREVFSKDFRLADKGTFNVLKKQNK